jgi:hypothetical protein
MCTIGIVLGVIILDGQSQHSLCYGGGVCLVMDQ